jgi:hypothetical protein
MIGSFVECYYGDRGELRLYSFINVYSFRFHIDFGSVYTLIQLQY